MMPSPGAEFGLIEIETRAHREAIRRIDAIRWELARYPHAEKVEVGADLMRWLLDRMDALAAGTALPICTLGYRPEGAVIFCDKQAARIIPHETNIRNSAAYLKGARE